MLAANVSAIAPNKPQMPPQCHWMRAARRLYAHIYGGEVNKALLEQN